MEKEKGFETEYKGVFTELRASEELRRNVQSLIKTKSHSSGTVLLKKLAIVATVIIALFLGSNGIAYAMTGKTWMGYLIQPGTKEWNDLGTVQNKKEASHIPEDVLRNMSDEELIQALLDYPFLVEIFVYNDYATGVQSVYNDCDALKELLSRPTGKDSLVEFLDKRTSDSSKAISGREAVENDAIKYILDELGK